MFSQMFGSFLVEKGVIDKAKLEAIIKEQSEAKLKLGTIAISEKLLTQAQADEINHLQTQMDKRFGDIAVEKKMLTEEQVKNLLSKQGNVFLKFVQLLAEKTDLTVDDISERVAEFQKEKGFSDSEMTSLKRDDVDAIVPILAFSAKPYVTELVGLVLRNMIRFVTSNFHIGRIKHISSVPYAFMAGQSVFGDHRIHLGFCTNGEGDGICRLASLYSGFEITELAGDAADAIGEFANINNGLLATNLSEKHKIDLDMEPPFTYANETAEGDAYVIPLFVEGKELSLYIAVDSDAVVGKNPVSFETTKGDTTVKEGSKGRVVIVDDSTMIRKMLRAMLEEEGYSVVAEAANGLEAVEAYKANKPDIISLDITMPKMDGLEALGKIKEFDPDANAIMVTAAGQQQKVIEALKLGANKFIMKPFTKDEVVKGFII